MDGDDFHSPAAIAKMRGGTALTDADRAPWLGALHHAIATALDRRESLVVACSALRQRYRDALRGDLRLVRFVYLKAVRRRCGAGSRNGRGTSRGRLSSSASLPR